MRHIQTVFHQDEFETICDEMYIKNVLRKTPELLDGGIQVNSPGGTQKINEYPELQESSWI